MQHNKQSLKLSNKKLIAPNTLELSYISEKPLAFIPGQFYSFHFEKGGINKARSYSAANPISNPRENRELSIAVTLYPEGFASDCFEQSEVGQDIEVSGPFGNLILPKQLPATVFLVATGTGVAPFRSMRTEIEKFLQQGEVRFVLAFGVRERADLLYDEEFSLLTRSYDNFSYEVYLSREQALHSHETSGRVTSLFAKHDIDADQSLAFVCGNPDMVDDVVEGFKQRGLETRQIKREKYTFSLL